MPLLCDGTVVYGPPGTSPWEAWADAVPSTIAFTTDIPAGWERLGTIDPCVPRDHPWWSTAKEVDRCDS